MPRQPSPTFTVLHDEEDSVASPPPSPGSSKGSTAFKPSSSTRSSPSRGHKRRAPENDEFVAPPPSKATTSASPRPHHSTEQKGKAIDRTTPTRRSPSMGNGGLVDPREVANRLRKEQSRTQLVQQQQDRLDSDRATKKRKASMGPPPPSSSGLSRPRPFIRPQSPPDPCHSGASSSSPDGSASPETPAEELEDYAAVRSDEEDRGSPIPPPVVDGRFRDAKEEMEHLDAVYYSNPLWKDRSPPPPPAPARKPTKPTKLPAAAQAEEERTRRGVWVAESLPFPKFSITMMGSKGRDSAAFSVSRDVYDAVFNYLLEHTPEV